MGFIFNVQVGNTRLSHTVQSILWADGVLSFPCLGCLAISDLPGDFMMIGCEVMVFYQTEWHQCDRFLVLHSVPCVNAMTI